MLTQRPYVYPSDWFMVGVQDGIEYREEPEFYFPTWSVRARPFDWMIDA